MPYTAKQNRLFRAAEHNPAFAKKVGIKQSDAKRMADEGMAKGGFMREKINRQDTKHGAMDMPNATLNKFRGMKHGGKVKRYADGEIVEGSNPNIDDETRARAMASVKSREDANYASQIAGLTQKAPVVTKEALAKSGLSLRDYMNKQQGLTRRVSNLSASPAAPSNLDARDRMAKAIELSNRDGRDRMAGYKKGGNVKAMEKKEMSFMKAKGAPKSMVAHEKKEYGMARGGMNPMMMQKMRDARMSRMAPPAAPMGMKKGGMPPEFVQKMMAKKAGMKMNMGGMAKYAKGGGIESHGKTKGTIIKMAAGGSVASRRGDGIAQRGKTKA